MNRHSSSSARSGRSAATFSTISWRCRSRSFTKAGAFCQSTKDRAWRSVGEPLADVGGDGLGPGLGAELEPQPALDRGVLGAELEQDLGQPSGAEGFEVREVDRLLRRHARPYPAASRTARMALP